MDSEIVDVLGEISNSLKVIAMVTADKQIAHLRVRHKEKEKNHKNMLKWNEKDDLIKEVEKDLDLYKFKIKSYEDLLYRRKG